MYTIRLNHIHPYSYLQPPPGPSPSNFMSSICTYVYVYIYICKYACIFNSLESSYCCPEVLRRSLPLGCGESSSKHNLREKCFSLPQQTQMDTLDFLCEVPVSLVATEIQRLGSHHTNCLIYTEFPVHRTPLKVLKSEKDNI